MNDRLMRVLAQFCEAAAWCFATGDDITAAYFIDSAARAISITDGAECVFDGNLDMRRATMPSHR